MIRKKVSSAEDALALHAFPVGCVFAGGLVLGGQVVDVGPLQEMIEYLYLVDVQLEAAPFLCLLLIHKGIADGLILN